MIELDTNQESIKILLPVFGNENLSNDLFSLNLEKLKSEVSQQRHESQICMRLSQIFLIVLIEDEKIDTIKKHIVKCLAWCLTGMRKMLFSADRLCTIHDDYDHKVDSVSTRLGSRALECISHADASEFLKYCKFIDNFKFASTLKEACDNWAYRTLSFNDQKIVTGDQKLSIYCKSIYSTTMANSNEMLVSSEEINSGFISGIFDPTTEKIAMEMILDEVNGRMPIGGQQIENFSSLLGHILKAGTHEFESFWISASYDLNAIANRAGIFQDVAMISTKDIGNQEVNVLDRDWYVYGMYTSLSKTNDDEGEKLEFLSYSQSSREVLIYLKAEVHSLVRFVIPLGKCRYWKGDKGFFSPNEINKDLFPRPADFEGMHFREFFETIQCVGSDDWVYLIRDKRNNKFFFLQRAKLNVDNKSKFSDEASRLEHLRRIHVANESSRLLLKHFLRMNRNECYDEQLSFLPSCLYEYEFVLSHEQFCNEHSWQGSFLLYSLEEIGPWIGDCAEAACEFKYVYPFGFSKDVPNHEDWKIMKSLFVFKSRVRDEVIALSLIVDCLMGNWGVSLKELQPYVRDKSNDENLLFFRMPTSMETALDSEVPFNPIVPESYNSCVSFWDLMLRNMYGRKVSGGLYNALRSCSYCLQQADLTMRKTIEMIFSFIPNSESGIPKDVQLMISELTNGSELKSALLNRYSQLCALAKDNHDTLLKIFELTKESELPELKSAIPYRYSQFRVCELEKERYIKALKSTLKMSFEREMRSSALCRIRREVDALFLRSDGKGSDFKNRSKRSVQQANLNSAKSRSSVPDSCARIAEILFDPENANLENMADSSENQNDFVPGQGVFFLKVESDAQYQKSMQLLDESCKQLFLQNLKYVYESYIYLTFLEKKSKEELTEFVNECFQDEIPALRDLPKDTPSMKAVALMAFNRFQKAYGLMDRLKELVAEGEESFLRDVSIWMKDGILTTDLTILGNGCVSFVKIRHLAAILLKLAFQDELVIQKIRSAGICCFAFRTMKIVFGFGIEPIKLCRMLPFLRRVSYDLSGILFRRENDTRFTGTGNLADPEQVSTLVALVLPYTESNRIATAIEALRFKGIGILVRNSFFHLDLICYFRRTAEVRFFLFKDKHSTSQHWNFEYASRSSATIFFGELALFSNPNDQTRVPQFYKDSYFNCPRIFKLFDESSISYAK